MEVVRGGQTVILDAVQFKVSGEGNDKSLDLDFKVLAEDASFFGAVGQTWGSTVSLVRNTWVSIGDLITGHIGISELSGPVGVGEVVGSGGGNRMAQPCQHCGVYFDQYRYLQSSAVPSVGWRQNYLFDH